MYKQTAVRRLLVIGVVFAAFMVVSFPQKVLATACANPSNYGSASWTTTIPATGTYTVWSRVLVPDSTNDSFQLEIDGANCWLVGGTNIPSNTWTWVNWYGGNTSQKVTHNFTTTGSHTVKIIGSAANVQVDKVVLLGSGEQCADGSTTPTGTGDNCSSGPTVQSGSTGGGSATDPINSGSTTPSIVTENQYNAAETQYKINGQVVQSSRGAAPLDTTKLADGTYEVETMVTLKDGSVLSEIRTITVDNSKTFIEKFGRLFVITGILIVIIGATYVIHRRKSRTTKSNPINSPESTPTIPIYNSHEPTVIVPTTKED